MGSSQQGGELGLQIDHGVPMQQCTGIADRNFIFSMVHALKPKPNTTRMNLKSLRSQRVHQGSARFLHSALGDPLVDHPNNSGSSCNISWLVAEVTSYFQGSFDYCNDGSISSLERCTVGLATPIERCTLHASR